MKNLYGSIDLTLIGRIVRQHPELIRKVQFKDGEHQLLNIDIHDKREADQYGNVAYIKAACKKGQQREGINYYLANLKLSQFQDEQQQSPVPNAQPYNQQQAPAPSSENDLPFDFGGVA